MSTQKKLNNNQYIWLYVIKGHNTKVVDSNQSYGKIVIRLLNCKITQNMKIARVQLVITFTNLQNGDVFLNIKTNSIHSAALMCWCIKSTVVLVNFILDRFKETWLLGLMTTTLPFLLRIILTSLNTFDKTRTITLVFISPLSYLMEVTGVNC